MQNLVVKQYISAWSVMVLNLLSFLLQNILFWGSVELQFLLSLQQVILVTQMIGLLVLDQYVIELSKTTESIRREIPSSVLVCMLGLIPIYFWVLYLNFDSQPFEQFLQPMFLSAGLIVFVCAQTAGLLFSQMAHSQNRIILSYVANMPTGIGMLVGTLIFYFSTSILDFLISITISSILLTAVVFRQFNWFFGKPNFSFVRTLIMRSLYVRGGHNIHNIFTPMYVINFAAVSQDSIAILNSKRIVDMIVNALLSVYSKRLLNQYLLVKVPTLANYFLPMLYRKIIYILGCISIFAAILLQLLDVIDMRVALTVVACALIYNMVLLTEVRYTLVNIINKQIRFIYVANISYVLVLVGLFKLVDPTLTNFWLSLAVGQILILLISWRGAVKINE